MPRAVRAQFAFSRRSPAWEKTFEGGEEDAFCRLFGPEKIPAHIDEFFDWFMVRKVMAGQDLLKASGTVTGKLMRWL